MLYYELNSHIEQLIRIHALVVTYHNEVSWDWNLEPRLKAHVDVNLNAVQNDEGHAENHQGEPLCVADVLQDVTPGLPSGDNTGTLY